MISTKKKIMQFDNRLLNRELYRIVGPWNYRGQQQLPDTAVAMHCVVAVYV